MDAYTNYILRASEARLGELRQEARERALVRAARVAKREARARDKRNGAAQPVALPTPASAEELRRSA